MFQDDEMKRRGRGRSGSLSPFGLQMNALRGGGQGRSMFGIGAGGGSTGNASGFAFGRKQAPVMNAPARPATGGVFAPSQPQMPAIDFTEADFVPDIATQVAPAQSSPVSQPPQGGVAAPPNPPAITPSQGGGMSQGGQQGMQQLPPWMTGGQPPQRPQMPSWMQGRGSTPPGMNMPRQQ